MDELLSQLQNVLGSKDGQDKLRDVASMLGGIDGNKLDLSSLNSLLNSENNSGNNSQNNNAQAEDANIEPNPLGNIDINMLMKVQKMMSGMNKDDKNSQLIKALRPHIRSEKSHKIDEAVRIMQLISMLPLLKESGLFGGGIFE